MSHQRPLVCWWPAALTCGICLILAALGWWGWFNPPVEWFWDRMGVTTTVLLLGVNPIGALLGARVLWKDRHRRLSFWGSIRVPRP